MARQTALVETNTVYYIKKGYFLIMKPSTVLFIHCGGKCLMLNNAWLIVFYKI